MSLLNTSKLPKIFAKTVGSTALFGEALTIRNRITAIDIDGVNSGAWLDSAAVGTRSSISRYRRETARIPDGVDEVLVYQYGAGAAPTRGGRIIFRGEEFEVLSVDPDPSNSVWTLRVRVL